MRILVLIIIMLLNSSPSFAGSFSGKRSAKPATAKYTPTKSVSAPKAKPTGRPKKGLVSKVIDAGARGYGWQLGKEAAKETIKAAKKAAPVIKEKAVELKDKITK